LGQHNFTLYALFFDKLNLCQGNPSLFIEAPSYRCEVCRTSGLPGRLEVLPLVGGEGHGRRVGVTCGGRRPLAGARPDAGGLFECVTVVGNVRVRAQSTWFFRHLVPSSLVLPRDTPRRFIRIYKYKTV